jgi:Flp pilus assembly protein TadG
MVETGLIMAVLLLFLLGMFDLGRAVYAYSDLSQAACEAARYGVSHPGDVAGARQAALNWSALNLSPGSISVIFTSASPPTVQVTIPFQFVAVSPLIAQVAGGQTGITITGRAVMVME